MILTNKGLSEPLANSMIKAYETQLQHARSQNLNPQPTFRDVLKLAEKQIKHQIMPSVDPMQSSGFVSQNLSKNENQQQPDDNEEDTRYRFEPQEEVQPQNDNEEDTSFLFKHRKKLLEESGFNEALDKILKKINNLTARGEHEASGQMRSLHSQLKKFKRQFEEQENFDIKQFTTSCQDELQNKEKGILKSYRGVFKWLWTALKKLQVFFKETDSSKLIHKVQQLSFFKPKQEKVDDNEQLESPSITNNK